MQIQKGDKMKILFIIDKLNTGGVSSSLFNLLKVISRQEDCSLLVFNGADNARRMVPENIKIVKPAKVLSILGMYQREAWKKSFWLGLFRLLLVFLSKLFSGSFARKILFSFVKRVKGYDAAISYTHDVSWKSLTPGCNQYLLDKVEANQKVSFVHCDYMNYGGYHPQQINTYKKFNHIICVSQACKKSFLKCFPQLQATCRVMENFTDTDKILALTQEFYKYDHNITNIVTVCRLTQEKGISRALDAFALLKQNGYIFWRWTIVGGGPNRLELEEKASRLGISKMVEFIGEKENPFYYMKDAEVFLLPSFHEAAPMVFGECKTLQLPIITTATISAKELVEDRHAGIVCENTMEGIYAAIKEVLETKNVPKANNDVTLVNHNAFSQLNALLMDLKTSV